LNKDKSILLARNLAIVAHYAVYEESHTHACSYILVITLLSLAKNVTIRA